MIDKAATVEVVSVDSVPLAVRDARVTLAELPTTIRHLLDDVWAFLRLEGDLAPGHNVVVYRGDISSGPADIEVGVQVGRRFEGSDPSGVRCSESPAGRAVRIVHRGPYDQMAPTYEALMAWVRNGGHTLAGPSWEVYGDWAEDPAKLETEISFLLEAS